MTGQTTSTAAVTEEERFDMTNALEAKLGRSTTMTLMRHLPPTGWGGVATIRDLDQLEARLDVQFERIDARFERIDARFERIDARFERIDARFDTIDARFETIDAVCEKRLAVMQASILKWNIATMLTLVSVVAVITLTLR